MDCLLVVASPTLPVNETASEPFRELVADGECDVAVQSLRDGSISASGMRLQLLHGLTPLQSGDCSHRTEGLTGQELSFISTILLSSGTVSETREDSPQGQTCR